MIVIWGRSVPTSTLASLVAFGISTAGAAIGSRVVAGETSAIVAGAPGVTALAAPVRGNEAAVAADCGGFAFAVGAVSACVEIEGEETGLATPETASGVRASTLARVN